jgi:hypothetical protein
LAGAEVQRRDSVSVDQRRVLPVEPADLLHRPLTKCGADSGYFAPVSEPGTSRRIRKRACSPSTCP